MRYDYVPGGWCENGLYAASVLVPHIPTLPKCSRVPRRVLLIDCAGVKEKSWQRLGAKGIHSGDDLGLERSARQEVLHKGLVWARNVSFEGIFGLCPACIPIFLQLTASGG